METFGYSTIGGSTAGESANYMSVQDITTPSDLLNVQSIVMYTNTSSTAGVRPVIYTDSSGSPGTFVAAGTETSVTSTLQWWTLNFSSPIVLSPSTPYWFGFWQGANITSYYDATAGYTRAYRGVTYASTGNPSGGGGGFNNASNWQYSLYVNYTSVSSTSTSTSISSTSTSQSTSTSISSTSSSTSTTQSASTSHSSTSTSQSTSTSTSFSTSSTSTSQSTTTILIDDRKPTGRIDPQVLTNSPLSGYETAIFDDPVHIFDDPDVLFGSESTAIGTMRTSASDNSPTIDGYTKPVSPGASDNAPNISIQQRR